MGQTGGASISPTSSQWIQAQCCEGADWSASRADLLGGEGLQPLQDRQGLPPVGPRVLVAAEPVHRHRHAKLLQALSLAEGVAQLLPDGQALPRLASASS